MAQNMSDSQVLEYVKEGIRQGKEQKQLASETNGNLTLTPDSHEFANKAAQRTFYDTNFLTTRQWSIIHTIRAFV